MLSLYVTSVERYSGKTAVCLSLGKRFQADGLRVGYLKPVSLQPTFIGNQIADEDAAFVIDTLGLPVEPSDLAPVIVTSDFLRQHLAGTEPAGLLDKLKAATARAFSGQDLMLFEGGASLREGYVVGLPTPVVAKALESQVLLIINYGDDVDVLDDALAAQSMLGQALCGVIINRVPAQAAGFVTYTAAPFLEKQDIPVFGILPETRSLAALSISELVDVLDAEVLTKKFKADTLVENLTVGAMTPDAALRHFRQQTRQAVITGGDRTDIQLAALETSTACLILTGSLWPSPLVVKQAEEFGIAVLLVPYSTMETVEAIERVYGKTRLGQPAKLRQFQALMNQHVDYKRLYQAVGVKVY